MLRTVAGGDRLVTTVCHSMRDNITIKQSSEELADIYQLWNVAITTASCVDGRAAQELVYIVISLRIAVGEINNHKMTTT